jgi:hypothetical protein
MADLSGETNWKAVRAPDSWGVWFPKEEGDLTEVAPVDADEFIAAPHVHGYGCMCHPLIDPQAPNVLVHQEMDYDLL